MIALFLTAMLAAPPAAVTTSADDFAGGSFQWQHLGPGAPVKVTTAGGLEVVGVVREVDPLGIGVDLATQQQLMEKVPAPRVARVEIVSAALACGLDPDLAYAYIGRKAAAEAVPEGGEVREILTSCLAGPATWSEAFAADKQPIVLPAYAAAFAPPDRAAFRDAFEEETTRRRKHRALRDTALGTAATLVLAAFLVQAIVHH